ncbi:hypothetical protein JCM11491_007229 [Sporobolomyces phaffii]
MVLVITVLSADPACPPSRLSHQDSSGSGDDSGTVRALAGRDAGLGTSTGTGTVRGLDGVDSANASSASSSSDVGESAHTAQQDAVRAMDRAARSAASSADQASIVAASHGRSVRAVAQAILDDDATALDAAHLFALADTLERFAHAADRTAGHVEAARELQAAHHATLAATGGAGGRGGEESKSYSLGTGRGRDRHRSGQSLAGARSSWRSVGY